MEYDGTRYYGFQLQAGVPTIQGKLEEALWRLTGERTRVASASRTDTGVHALGQVVSFRTASALPPETFVRGLNHYLPGDIAVKAAYRAEDGFDVRRRATSREYVYYILNSPTRSPVKRHRAHLVTGLLNIEAMDQACRMLIGEHDFASFASELDAGEQSTVRTVHHAGVERKGQMVILSLIADSFLRHQVRNTAGSLLRVGMERLTLGDFRNIIEAKRPGLAGPRAPACGLYLVRVNYPYPFDKDISGDADENLCYQAG